MFFIVGCGRSGTTAVSKLLQLAENLDIKIETPPYFAEQNRLLSTGILFDKKLAVENFLNGNEIRKNKKKNKLYGEKQVTLGPFIEEIHKQSGAKFIFVHRDGREVVQSFIEWNKIFGSIYREAEDIKKELSVEAKKAAMSLTLDHDYNDISRPRLLRNEIDLNNWLKLSNFEMICYMWSEINMSHYFSFNKIPKKDVYFLNINNFDLKSAKELFLFLEQPCPPIENIENIITKRINSVSDRKFNIVHDHYSEWPNWSQNDKNLFEEIAGPTMELLGYWNKKPLRWKPLNYGSFWKKKTELYDWFVWMFNHRKLVHNEFFKFFDKIKLKGEKITSIMDIGCGIGHGYTEQYKDIDYIGIDLNINSINLAKKNNVNHKHRFIYHDFLHDKMIKKADIVMSSGTIDNTYDVPLFIEQMVSAAEKYIYISAYKGWFPEVEQHIYKYEKESGYYNNIISPSAVCRQLRKLGCTEISARPIMTGHDDIPFETEIFAKISCN